MSLTGDVSMNVLSTKAITVKLRIWSHLLKKSLMENFIFCAVSNNNGNSNIKSRIYKNVNNTHNRDKNKDKHLLITQITLKRIRSSSK